MVRSLLGLFLFLLLLAPMAAAPTQSQNVPPQSTAPEGLDLPRLESQAILWLEGLIRINTSNPPGNDIAAANYLAGILRQEGINAQTFQSAPKQGFLVARLAATALPNPSRALLLVGHLDTGRADPSKWRVDPFGGMVQNNDLYGCGAIDDKSMTIANMAVLIALKRANAHLDRDVIFLATGAGSGPHDGMRFVVEKYWDQIAAGFAINTGGRVVLKNGKVQYVGIQIDEKVSRNLEVIAKGAPGRGSLPPANDAVTHLAAAIQKIAAYQTPLRLNFLTHDYFDDLANIEDEETAKWMRALEQPEREAHAAEWLTEANPIWGEMVHDTISPTVLQAGTNANAIPAEARGVVNLRLLPGTLVEPLVAKLQKAVDDPQVSLAVESGGAPPAPASSNDSDLYNTIAQVAKQQFPGTAVLPYISIQSTDSPYLRERSVQTYGLLPFPLTENDSLGAREPNERINLDIFRKGFEFLYAIVTNFAVEKQ